MCDISVSTALFDGHSLETAFEEIAAAGIRSVEPAYIAGYTDFTEDDFSEASGHKLAELANKWGLRCGSISAHLDLGSSKAQTQAMLNRRIQFAAASGARILVTNAGLALDKDRILARVEAALPLCEDLNITLALENPGHGAGAAIHDAASGIALVRQLDHQHLRLNYDTCNVYSYSGGQKQPRDDLAGVDRSWFGQLHIKDLRSKGPDWHFCAIGDGEVDNEAVLQQLPGLPLSLELPMRLSRPMRGDPKRTGEPLVLSVTRAALLRSTEFVAGLPGPHS